MKFVKLLKKYMDESDEVYEVGSVLEVSDSIADELIKAARAEAHSGIVNEIKAEDVAGAVKKAVEEAMQSAVKTDEKVIKHNIEVVKDAPLWKDTGDFLMAVKKAATGNIDERLYKGSGEGQEEADNAEGGYLVEHRIGQEIYQACQQSSVLLPKCDQMEIGPNANGMKINQVNETERSATTLFGGVRIYSMAEGAAKTPFIQKYTQVDISLGKYAAVNYVTDELLQDRTALRSFINSNVGQAFAWVIDDDILHGTTNASMIEIENHASTVQVAMTGGANPNAVDLSNMFIAMQPCSVARAEWYMSSSQYAAIQQLEDTSGRKLVQPSFESPVYGMLFGRPINRIEQADVDANDTSIMFLDLSQYLVIKKGGLDQATSIHVKFLDDETCFRWVMRLGGSPKLASTVTLPDNTVVSSFVTRD